jgi:hypothetical protein
MYNMMNHMKDRFKKIIILNGLPKTGQKCRSDLVFGYVDKEQDIPSMVEKVIKSLDVKDQSQDSSNA